MKRAAWIAGFVLILVGVGFRLFKRPKSPVDLPPSPSAAPVEQSGLPPSLCPPYTLDDNGVCIPVPRASASPNE